MHDICTYHIEIRGRIEEESFNANSPLKITATQQNPTAALLITWADQSGLIGLLRYLHQQGFVILSIKRQCETNT